MNRKFPHYDFAHIEERVLAFFAEVEAKHEDSDFGMSPLDTLDRNAEDFDDDT